MAISHGKLAIFLFKKYFISRKYIPKIRFENIKKAQKVIIHSKMRGY